MPIQTSEVGHIVEWAVGGVAQNRADLADRFLRDPDRQFVAIELHRLDHRGIPFHQSAQGRMCLQLLDIGDGRSQRHQESLRLAAVSPQSSTPFFHTYKRPTSTIPMYTIISQKPNIFSSRRMTAQG